MQLTKCGVFAQAHIALLSSIKSTFCVKLLTDHELERAECINPDVCASANILEFSVVTNIHIGIAELGNYVFIFGLIIVAEVEWGCLAFNYNILWGGVAVERPASKDSVLCFQWIQTCCFPPLSILYFIKGLGFTDLFWIVSLILNYILNLP